jgi:hypothetical protein
MRTLYNGGGFPETNRGFFVEKLLHGIALFLNFGSLAILILIDKK